MIDLFNNHWEIYIIIMRIGFLDLKLSFKVNIQLVTMNYYELSLVKKSSSNYDNI